MDQEEQNSFFQVFLSTKSLAAGFDILTRYLELTSIMKARASELQGLKVDLQTDKKSSEVEKSKLQEYQHNLDDQKQIVIKNKSDQSQILTETKNSEVEYQKLVKNSEAKKAALEKEIFDYESKLKYILNPKTIPKAGTSVFSWPLDKIVVTQQFGRTSASGRLYVSGSHNGMDLGTPLGSSVKSMANGVVIGAGNTDLSCPGASWGGWVLIKYDSGLTAIFAHLSVIKVSEGQRVQSGDLVAYSGSTGYSTGPHLHISVYPADAVSVQDRPSISCSGKILHMPIAPVNSYLDPAAYLPK